jgi:hypothetical protein
MEAAHATALLEQRHKALKEMEDYVQAVRHAVRGVGVADAPMMCAPC